VRQSARGHAPAAFRRSVLGRRETSSPPVMPYGAQDSVGRPRRESGEREPGTYEVRVHVSFVWVAEFGRTHRASFPPGGCKVSWRVKGASQEEVRSSV
jgi:hypothetical protein